jgi:hypothetical protein
LEKTVQRNNTKYILHQKVNYKRQKRNFFDFGFTFTLHKIRLLLLRQLLSEWLEKLSNPTIKDMPKRYSIFLQKLTIQRWKRSISSKNVIRINKNP